MNKSIKSTLGKLGATAAATFMLYSPASAQCPQAPGSPPVTIKPIDVIIDSERYTLTPNQTINLDYEHDLRVVPQNATIVSAFGNKHVLTTKTYVQKMNNGRWEYVLNNQGEKRIFEGVINPESFGVADNQAIRLILAYEDICGTILTSYFDVIQGERPTEVALPETPVQPRPVARTVPAKPTSIVVESEEPIKMNIKGEAKLVALIGDEKIDLDSKEVSSPVRGFLGQGIVRASKATGFVTMLGTRQDLEYQAAGGVEFSKYFRQFNGGATFRFLEVLVAEVEGISTSSGWTSNRTPLIRSTIDQARYGGIFVSGGLIIPSGDGFLSSTYLQVNGGIGRGIQSLDYTDHLYRNITFKSTLLNEVFVTGALESPYLRLKGSFGNFKSSSEVRDDPRLEGKRASVTVAGNIPLKKGIYLTLQGIFSKTTFDGIDRQIPELNVNLIGAGITIRK